MWIMLSDAFISIVAKDCGPNELLVRARRAGDIRKVFGKFIKVTRYTRSDYLYRAVMPKHDVMEALARAVENIDYPNFKDSVRDDKLHEAYLRVWTAMATVQPLPPYSGCRAKPFPINGE